jgi:FtsP/CotA-like multicopper oxidase with cupredoxin domain
MESTQESHTLSRRALLRTAAASAGVIAAAGAGGPRAMEALAAPPKGTTRYPLYVPPTYDVGGFQAPFALAERPGVVDLGGGNLSNAWVYNGLMPGPTFRARRGDRAQITLTNELPQETITHWHGMVVDHENDGHPIYAIPPGNTYGYNFTIDQRAALNWYHPHPHMLTGEQVCLGLAGAFIVNDAEEDALKLPTGAYEVPLVVRDAQLDNSGNLQYKPRSGGFLGNIVLVNGTRDPYLNVDTALYRFRMLAGSNSRIFGLALGNGAPLALIGNDGGLLATAVQVAQIDLSPGERVDVLVDFRGLPVGTRLMLRDLRAGWDVLEFRVVRQVNVAGTIPTTLSTITSLSNPVVTREFSFDGMSKINGLRYDVHRIDFQVPFGQTERWRFTTSGNAPHPIHVHGASFQVVSRTGGRNRLFPWEAGWKDTVLQENRETIEVLIRFDQYRGLYLLHCHKLEHEDMGMMSNFEVI